MIGGNQNVFQLSVIELFIIILFVGLAYSYHKVSEAEKKIKETQPTVDEIDVDSLLVAQESEIEILSDSLKILYGQYEFLRDLVEKDRNIGTGKGSCWKRTEGGKEVTISILQVTIFDNKILSRNIWPISRDAEARRLLGSEIYNEFNKFGKLTSSPSEFLNNYERISNIASVQEPPCFHIVDLVDSTTTKDHYKDMHRIVNQRFLTRLN